MHLCINYQTRRFLRKGGSGALYETINLLNDEIVVAKIVPFLGHEVEQAFKHEVEIMCELKDCPNILNIIEYETTRNYGCIILPQMKGDLIDLLEECFFLEEKIARQVFYQICVGVKVCHDKGIAHLDIKPDNILQSYSGNIYLADFGGSVKVKKMHDFIFTGTKVYAAPEVRGRCKLNHPLAADVWSLGIVLFTLLTGAWPYCDDNITPDTPPELQHPQLSFESSRFLKKILQRDPLLRPTIDDVLSDPWFSPALKRPHRSTTL